MEINPYIYNTLLKTSYLALIISSFFVIINAVRSAREMGGSLGLGLKKIAAGTILYTISFIVYLALEEGLRGMLSDEQIRLFFILTGLVASTFLITGFLQVYRITKKLRLFSP